MNWCLPTLTIGLRIRCWCNHFTDEQYEVQEGLVNLAGSPSYKKLAFKWCLALSTVSGCPSLNSISLDSSSPSTHQPCRRHTCPQSTTKIQFVPSWLHSSWEQSNCTLNPLIAGISEHIQGNQNTLCLNLMSGLLKKAIKLKVRWLFKWSTQTFG